MGTYFYRVKGNDKKNTETSDHILLFNLTLLTRTPCAHRNRKEVSITYTIFIILHFIRAINVNAWLFNVYGNQSCLQGALNAFMYMFYRFFSCRICIFPFFWTVAHHRCAVNIHIIFTAPSRSRSMKKPYQCLCTCICIKERTTKVDDICSIPLTMYVNKHNNKNMNSVSADNRDWFFFWCWRFIFIPDSNVHLNKVYALFCIQTLASHFIVGWILKLSRSFINKTSLSIIPFDIFNGSCFHCIQSVCHIHIPKYRAWGLESIFRHDFRKRI